jgi:hypothetical protein
VEGVSQVVIAVENVRTDSGGSGAEWIACAAGQAFVTCVGTGVGQSWRTVFERPISKVVANPRKVCVVEAKNALCASSVGAFANWTRVGDGGSVVDIALSTRSISETFCIAEESRLRCQEGGATEGKRESEFQQVIGPTFFEKIWLLDSGFQGIQRLCSHSRGLLWCDVMSRNTNGLTYKLRPAMATKNPVAVLTPSYLATELSEGVRTKLFSKIFVLDSNGLALVLEPTGGLFGVSRGGIPVSFVSRSTNEVSTKILGSAGSTNSLALIPLKFSIAERGPNVPKKVVFTSDGKQLSGAKVRWLATDGFEDGQRNSNTDFRTDERGELELELPIGFVTFTVSDARTSDEAILEASMATVEVSADGIVSVEIPGPPAVNEVKVKVALPDGTPVPNAVVNLESPFVSYAYTSAGQTSAAWSNRRIDEEPWFFPLFCPWCVATSTPAFVTGVDGTLKLRVFEGAPITSISDGFVAYYDGMIRQSAPLVLGGSEVNVQLPLMAQLNLVQKDEDPSTEEVDIDMRPTGEAWLAVELEEWLDADSPSKPEIEPVCELMESGGAYDPSNDITQLCSPDTESSVVGKSAVGSSQRVGRARANLSCGKRGKVKVVPGVVTRMKVCATKSQKVRVRMNRALPTRVVCIRVGGIPCAPAVSSSGVNSIPTTLKRGSRMALSVFTSSTKKRRGNRKVGVTSAGSCSVSRSLLRVGRKSGLCQVLVWKDRRKTQLIERFDIYIR